MLCKRIIERGERVAEQEGGIEMIKKKEKKIERD